MRVQCFACRKFIFNLSKIHLDACVGAGFMAIPLAQAAQEVVVIDINPAHLALAQENARRASITNITFILGDITDSAVLEKMGLIDGMPEHENEASSMDGKTRFYTYYFGKLMKS